MFPRYRGGLGAGRGLVLCALALVLGTSLLLASGDGSATGTTRLEATQASVSPYVLDPGAGPVATTAPGLGTAVEVPVALATSVPAASDLSPLTSSSTAAPPPATEPAVAPTSTVAAAAATAGVSATTTPTPTVRAAEVTTSTSTTTTTTAPPGPARDSGAEAQVVPLTDRDRNGQGLGSLARNSCLDSVASRYAERMARSGVLAHNPGAGAAITGCRPGATWGDNVGTAEPCDAALLEERWMASPGHRRNILTGAFQLIGVGAWTDELGGCWVQVLFSS